MRRLLARARQHAGDPEIYSGLVQACRSAASSTRPLRPTSGRIASTQRSAPPIGHAYLSDGKLELALEVGHDDLPVPVLALELMGRTTRRSSDSGNGRTPTPRRRCSSLPGQSWHCWKALQMSACGSPTNSRVPCVRATPCGLYYLARHLARAGHPRALSVLQRSVNGGFVCEWFLNEDPWLDAIRGEPGFDVILEQATARIHAARDVFRQADGFRIMGLVGATSPTDV